MKSEAEWKGNLFYVFGSLARGIARTAQKDLWLAGIDTTFEQNIILMELERRDGQSQQQLAEATGKDKPSITRLLDNMIKRDLLHRGIDKNDRRVNLIHLTAKGRQIQKKIFSRSQKDLKELLTGITTADLHTWFQVMDKLLSNTKQREEILTLRIKQAHLQKKLSAYEEIMPKGEPQ